MKLQSRRWALLAIASGLAVSCINVRDYGDGNGGGEQPDARTGGTSGLFHGAGYSDGAAHGIESNLQILDCRECHGDDLTGGTSAVSCDSAGCHSDNWRTDCAYCHGTDMTGGAPPRDIDGVSSPDQASFRAHTAHVTQQNHAPFECSQCHVNPTDVLSPGHAFDDTPGKAEVTFAASLSSSAVYEGDGSCANMYCHGDGRDRMGTSKHDDGAKDCASCHPSKASGQGSWANMSGNHIRHLRSSPDCGDCHGTVADLSNNIVGPELHVNGNVDFEMAGTGISYSSGCTGFCHGKGHFFDQW